MRAPCRVRELVPIPFLLLVLSALVPLAHAAGPEPAAGASRGFRLFARSHGALAINRVYCGLESTGRICVDSANASTIGGAFWPRGTPDMYIFGTGPQVAGIIGPDGGPWAGDTTGAFFFDLSGTKDHGLEVTPVYNTADAVDYANWPEAAKVPSTDESAALFHPLLRVDPNEPDLRRKRASDGDAWWLMWEGDSTRMNGRPHPLGVLVETRAMGWNYPLGNNDIIFFIYTLYNITSTEPADYSGVRPELRSYLLDRAQIFQAENNARFGVTLPAGGYTINEMYFGLAADMDVGSAGTNYSSVNVPMGVGYTYDRAFTTYSGWDFDPAIFSPPFLRGAGFVGMKFLSGASVSGGLKVYSNLMGSSPFPGAVTSPQNTTQLWTYLSGTFPPASCNSGPPDITHICSINNTAPHDSRFFQSAPGFVLPAGGSASIVVAYLFAAPVAIGGCSVAPCDVKPGDPTILGDPVAMAGGVNPIDSLTGFLGATDLDGSGRVEQAGALGPEWTVVPGSLLGKAYVAQAVFDAGFLVPMAPAAPEFFLIPGDNQVTVLWQPSPSENVADPYFALTQDPASALYDPNYREFDVEGYRIYRGRTSDPASLTLLMQFDYAGTVLNDYSGLVNPVDTCAPELGLYTDCPVAYTPPSPGVPRTVAHPNGIYGALVQTRFGDRIALGNGAALLLDADTVMGGSPEFKYLWDSGVPFSYVDRSVRNNFRYYYVVTSFDVNSLTSGPSSQESFRGDPVAVTPKAPASNYVSAGAVSYGIYGRDVALDYESPVPPLDPVTGRFAGIMPAANAWSLEFTSFIQEVIGTSGHFAVRLDSLTLGSSYNTTDAGTEDLPITYHLAVVSGATSTPLTLSITQDPTDRDGFASATFDAIAIDNDLASLYGGSDTYMLQAEVALSLPGTYYTNAYGRGCVNGAYGFDFGNGCDYNGPRWFAGPSPANNETKADPIYGNAQNFTTGTVDVTAFNSTGWNNAGELPGVSVIHQPYSYQTMGNQWRSVEGVLAGGKRQADYNVYWGAGGRIDSVIDATHNVVVPFDSTEYRGGWGILNQAGAPTAGAPGTITASFDARDELSLTDFGCVEPFRSYDAPQSSTRMRCGTAVVGDGPLYVLTRTAVPGPIVHFTTTPADARTRQVAGENGFALLLGGNMFMFQLAGGALPPAGRVWSMRDYVGAITGGNGFAGNDGPYAYAVPFVGLGARPFSAVGAELRANYDVVHEVTAASNEDLSRVHTVPDPYYRSDGFGTAPELRVVKFVNLPTQATIRIYSTSGVLVQILNHSSAQFGGSEDWDLKNRGGKAIASGVYFYHIESGDARRVGRMTIVNFATQSTPY